MDFQLPTTKGEMYNTLKDIFYFYRFQPILYTGVDLKELDLPRMEYTFPTASELNARATKLLSASQQREIASAEREYDVQIKALNERLSKIDTDTNTLIQSLEEKHLKDVQALERQAVKNGVAYSDIVHARVTELQTEKNARITDLLTSAQDKKNELQAQITVLQEYKAGVREYLRPFHSLEVTIKADELKAQAEKTEREVFEYNNNLYRKEQEYSNSLIRQKANLELKFLEIRSGEFSKEELIDMGYYDDVLRCVGGYYDTLAPLTAYQDFLEEKKLMLYLEDYYDDVLFLYKTKAL